MRALRLIAAQIGDRHLSEEASPAGSHLGRPTFDTACDRLAAVGAAYDHLLSQAYPLGRVGRGKFPKAFDFPNNPIFRVCSFVYRTKQDR